VAEQVDVVFSHCEYRHEGGGVSTVICEYDGRRVLALISHMAPRLSSAIAAAAIQSGVCEGADLKGGAE
jgi:hypothetical protein